VTMKGKEIPKCPLLSASGEYYNPCLLEDCAWFNHTKHICAIADIADKLKYLMQGDYELKVTTTG